MALSSTEKLRRRLRNLAKREKHIVVCTGLLRVLIAIVVFGGMFFLVDWMLRLSVLFRLLCLGAGLAGLVWLVRLYIRTPLSVKRNEETVALKLENRFEYLNDRLISVIQLTRPGSEADKSAMSQSLISRLESDVADISYDIRFSEIFDWKFIRRIVLISLVIFSFALMSYASFPEYVMTTVKRMFLSSQNYPVLTRITVDEHKTKIVEGDDWTVNVSLAGEIPSSVYLRTRKTDTEEDWEEYELKPGLGYTYYLTLKKVRNTFDFRIYAGDGITDSVRVKVIKLLTISDPELDVTPPSYTGIDPVENVILSSAPLVESAEVRITVPANKKLVSGRLLTAVGTAVELKPDPSGVSASGTFIVRSEPLTGSSVRLNGTDKKVQVDHSGTLDCGKDNGDLTVELWLNLKQGPNGSWRIIVHKGSDKKERTFYMALHPRSNRIHYRISTDKSWNEGGDTEREVPLNRWTHIAYVKKDNVLELYINGERDSRVQLSGGVKANQGPIHIGNSPWEKGMNAALDNLLIYSRALSQREVRNHYNNGLGTDSFSRKGLQAGYLFDGTEEDMSGNGNTARFINKPAVASGIVKSLRNIDGTKILCGRSGIVSFTVRLKDTDGLYNTEPLIRYSFRVKKDMSPKIRITYPGREQTSVPFAQWKLEYTASDDYGIRKTWLGWGIYSYSLDEDTGDTDYDEEYTPEGDYQVSYEKTGRNPLTLPGDSIVRFKGEAGLNMVDLNVVPGKAVDVWIEAADARYTEKSRFAPDAEIAGLSKSNPVRFIIIDKERKWLEIHEKLQNIETDIIQIKDRQEDIKDDMKQIKKNVE